MKLARVMWVYLQLILAMLFYGGSFVSTKIGLTEFGPITVLAIRLVVSAAFLSALDRWLPRGPSRPGPGLRKWPARADLPPILLITLFQPLLYFIAENVGLQYVSASIAAIIIGTIPVFTPFVAGPFLGERIGLSGAFGLFLSLTGVAVIVLEKRLIAEFTPLGLVLIFAAVLAAVGYSVAVRKTPARYRPLTIVKLQSLLGLPVIVLLGVLTEGLPRVLPTPRVFLHLLYLGLFPSSIAFVFLSTGIRALGANRANVFTNLVPVFTAIIAWAFTGESFTIQKIVGMVIVIVGVLVAQVGRRRSAVVDSGHREGHGRGDRHS